MQKEVPEAKEWWFIWTAQKVNCGNSGLEHFLKNGVVTSAVFGARPSLRASRARLKLKGKRGNYSLKDFLVQCAS